MMPDNDDFSDASQFYNTEGRKILTASLIAFYFAGYDFIDTCKMVFQSSWKDLFSRIDETKNQDAIQYINSFEGASEQNTSGCKQACDAVIKLFATNETIQKSIGRPVDGSEGFDPSKLETKNVFVVIDDSKLKLYAPLLHLITAQCLEFFSERSNESKTNILFCLDEFVSLGKLEITDALRKLRKKHVRIMILTQSMADIDLLYGKSERMAMMNNFSFKVILEASDTETQDYFAKLIGYKPTKKKSVSTSNVNTTKTLADDKEWIIEPAKLARLGDSLILLYREGYKLLKKNFYFKH
ncbi:type IV secretory system conjugative DNA transfer family protein [uncultured Holdemanella sp.]|jgi:type IV secretory pathway TraG/TraD family ATPase VirD4|uniref:type IV secretory system conjugative DNA transfer family protein n=1 Tax=uncultured Holdemanella sp. TaxID=1763549 RepID=UPI003435ADC0